ncbi:hypothetical protein [Bradyrhizobium sp. 21]|uniref:hypothetical protein n=1 Tax=Bradyrhizobium sp. 21 TaxID=2782666 RepID=UPI001FF80A7E|nr:hypothetical protein [Bradyrhizobium sp. 21]MCK1387886.1 hypothetical protein [Bradyrhizobium sp. 21]
MRFEVLPGLPPYGPPAVSFTENGPREWREGQVVRFYPSDSEPWVGNFLGGLTKFSSVLRHPNGSDVIVIAMGEAVVVDPETRTLRDRIGAQIEEIFVLEEEKSVVFRSIVDFCAIAADNTKWHSPRVSWDGFRGLKRSGLELSGEAWTPIQDAWVPFQLDLSNGQCLNAIYQADMSRAREVVARPTPKS